MKRAWERWVTRCAAWTDPRPLALVRVLVCLAIAVDLLRALQLGLVDDMFRTWEVGGMVLEPAADWWLDGLLGPTWAGPVAWVLTLACVLCAAVGVGTRPALILGALFYAQLGHGCPFGDRAIDRLLRTMMLVLAFSGSDARYTLFAPRADRIRRWPQDLIAWILVIMYLSAGVGKLRASPDWVSWSGLPALYRILCDPLSSTLDPVAGARFMPLFRLGSWATIAVELSAVLAITRWAPWWALCAAPIHVGIALTMKLGMFSYGMLALYPVLWAPWIIAGLDRVAARRAARA